MPNRGKKKEKELYEKWWVMTKKEREEAGLPLTQVGMGKKLGVSMEAANQWQRDFMEEGKFTPRKRARNGWKAPLELPEEMMEQLRVGGGFWTEERIEQINQAIFDSAQAGNANSQKLVKQITGELAEKKEVKFVLSADDYFQIRRAAAERIRGLDREGDGDRGVQPKSEVFFPNEGVLTEPKYGKDGAVAAMEVSA